MSLYLKYRPQQFSQIKGNGALVSALESILEKPEKMPHSYLISGPTGCGKTTIGRIIKNRLEIADTDYTEINSSDFRGIDTIREIIKNIQYLPMNSKYRIYLLDECHKLSNDAQNALLKALEDTPAHIIFILCTTDPDKLIKAIIGRCIHFPVQQLNEREMKALLKSVAKKEDEDVENEVLEQIVLDSQGHPRNALNILERVLNTSPEKRLEAAKQASAEISQSIELCRALIGRKNWKEIASILDGLKGQEPESIRRAVMGYCQAILLKTDNAQAGLVMECMIEPFYNTGFPGLVFACYQIIKG